jgi:transposase
MLTLPPSVRVYLGSRPVDMRCGHDGLMAIIRNQWRLDPFVGHIFAFVGRKLDRAKLLYFDRGGFVLIYKRLERGRFKLPVVKPTDESIEIDGAQLAMLLDGIDFARVRRPPVWKPSSLSSINRPIDPESGI